MITGKKRIEKRKIKPMNLLKMFGSQVNICL